MIVKMKKTTLLCLASDQAATLKALRDLGVLHLQHIQEPESCDLDQARNRLASAQEGLQILSTYENVEHKNSRSDADGILEEVLTLANERKVLAEQIDSLNQERSAQAFLGEFNPSLLAALGEKGISISLYSVPSKTSLQPPEGTVITVLNEDKSGKIIAITATEEFECHYDPLPVPQKALSDLDKEITAAQEKMSHIDANLGRLAGERSAVDEFEKKLASEVSYLEARDGMGESGKIVYLSGYCPADKVSAIQSAAKRHGWGLVTEQPSAEDSVPTLIRFPAWVRPIESVLRIIDLLPGYRENDISAVFLIAFSLFFAMLVGDAGYGLLFLFATIALRMKFKKAPKYPFVMAAILSSCTVVWGVITANYFGFSPKPLRFLQVTWLADGLVTNENNLSVLCFLIGAIHITIAHVWRVVLLINSTRALAQLGWISVTWAMYFAALNLVLGHPLSPLFLPLLAVGLALVVLFMVPIKRLKQDGLSFVTLPFDVIGGFVDVVSYIRLFAVGSASLAVAVAFNQLALGAGIIGAFIILLFGHLLNILLCIMGVLVHGIRLNTLEFSGHMDMSWSGFKYKPFRKSAGKA